MTTALEPSLQERFPRLVQNGGRAHRRELEELQAQVRRFADEHMRPRALEIDRRAGADPRYFDWDLVRAGADAGMLRFLSPRPSGGAGGLSVNASVVMEELSAACPGIGLIFGANALGMIPLLCAGAAHWDGLLAELIADERAGSPTLMGLAVTEPEAGTDVEDPDLLSRARIGTHARRVPGGFRLSGTKRFISNGSVARWIAVFMPTDPRRPSETWTCFVVDTRSEGFAVNRVEHKMGQRASPAAELTFDGVFIPDERVVGRSGDGMALTMLLLATSRPPVGAIATGIARGAYERLLVWLQDDPAASGLLEREHVQLVLASMEEEIHLARQAYMDAATEVDNVALGPALAHPLVRTLARLPASVRGGAAMRGFINSERGREITVRLLHHTTSDDAVTRAIGLASLAKAHGADVAMRVTGAALELVGLRGGAVRAEIEKLWRDAKLTQIYEGTNQLNRLAVYRGLCTGETLSCLPPLQAIAVDGGEA